MKHPRFLTNFLAVVTCGYLIRGSPMHLHHKLIVPHTTIIKKRWFNFIYLVGPFFINHIRKAYIDTTKRPLMEKKHCV